MTRFLQLLLAVWLTWVGAGMARAEIVVVVDAASTIGALERDDVINIFLGRHRVLPGGMAAVPVDLPAASSFYETFYLRLVGKTPTEIRTYWARLHFSGKTRPPLPATTREAAIAHVLGTPGGIAYLDRAQVNARLRIVHTLGP